MFIRPFEGRTTRTVIAAGSGVADMRCQTAGGEYRLTSHLLAEPADLCKSS